MRVTLKFVLDCSPEAAWEALRSPAGMDGIYAPFLRVRSLEPGGLPERWPHGAHGIEMRLFGLVPVGRQLLDISYTELPDGTRVMSDAGLPLTGLLARLDNWRHRMAVTPDPRGRTLYRDRLDIGYGLPAVLAWPLLWGLWQWRGRKLRRLGRLLPLA